MNRTLVHVMTHIKTEDEGKLFRVWQHLLERLNPPDYDVVIVESASPLDIRQFLVLPDQWKMQWLVNDNHIPTLTQRHTIAAFHNKLGHPWWDGVETGAGSNRAHMKGMELAIANNYERYVYIEADVLFAKPIQWAFDMMEKPVASGPLLEHGKFPDMGLMFASTEHLWKTNFVEKYDWRGQIHEGERKMWEILGDSLHILPLKGCRDGGKTKPGKLAEYWPEGIDYLTHATLPVQADFLRLNGFPDLAKELE